ncbi:unnamed protein product, partial [marine sediment metagenome]
MLQNGTLPKLRQSLEKLDDSRLAELEQQILTKSGCLWLPQEGPQTQAYNLPVYELYYGGAAGGGKTDLLIGLAATQHRRSIIFRRIYKQLRDIKTRAKEILRGTGATYNDTQNLWQSIPGDRTLEFGAIEYDDDKENYQGRVHDLKAWDELPQFLESQYLFVNAWTRTTEPNQP